MNAPHKYTASILAPSMEPPRIRTRGSQSPAERDHESRGGGSGSRRRSPGYRDRRGGQEGRDRRRSESPDRERFPKRRVEYSGEEQERDRALERKKYEDNAVEKPKEPPKPNFAPSGLLAKETNTVKGVQLKYNEPPEARKPLKNWRLYVFKGKDQVDLVHIYKQSCYLVGRDDKITDIPVNHPSCSKQHAAIQYRQVQSRNEYGDVATEINPYIIDLESTNGTFVNDVEIPKASYYQLKHTDVVKFGTSTREYVLVQEDVSA